jgi:hypothetical protein
MLDIIRDRVGSLASLPPALAEYGVNMSATTDLCRISDTASENRGADGSKIPAEICFVYLAGDTEPQWVDGWTIPVRPVACKG